MYDIGSQIYMKKILKLIPLLAVMLVSLAVPMRGHALDFGDFAGDSDWGGSRDSDNDRDSDSRSDRNSKRRSKRDKNTSHSSSSSAGTDADPKASAVFLLVITALSVALYGGMSKYSKMRRRRRAQNRAVKQNNDRQQKATLRNIGSFTREDPSFSAEDFRKKLAWLYVEFQRAWQTKDLTPVRHYLTDAYYSQMDAQLDVYRKNNQTNHVDNIKVISTEISGWNKEDGQYTIIARITARITDYVTDDTTGSIVRGSNAKEKILTYEWTLARTSDVTTSRSAGTTEQTCPHCGAVLTLNRSGVCDYCGAVVISGSFDWAVRNIKGISQKTL